MLEPRTQWVCWLMVCAALASCTSSIDEPAALGNHSNADSIVQAGPRTQTGVFANITALGSLSVDARTPSTALPAGFVTAQGMLSPATPPQPGSLLDPARAIVWNPGLNSVGGIPNRTTLCATLSPSGGDDTTAIQNAINACPANQVVRLTAGTFRISGQGLNLAKSNITLRGAGPGATRILRVDTQGNANITLGVRWSADKRTQAINLAVDGKKDATTITLASAPSPALQPGELVTIDSLTDPSISVWSDRSPPGDPSRGWFSRYDRPLSQMFEVVSNSGTSVTFNTPLHVDFKTAFTAQLTRFGTGTTLTPATKYTGVEDLTLEGGRGGDSGGNLHFEVAAYSWAKNIESTLSYGSGVNLDSAFRCEVRDSYLHTAGNPNPGGEGYLLNIMRASSDNLVENNVIWNGNKMLVMRASGGGNVIGYNYAQDAYGAQYPDWSETGLNAAHMTTAHHELFEGNEAFNFDSDSIWGNSAYVTVFRNNFTGRRTSKAPLQLSDQGNRRVIGLTKWSWFYSFIGNVLGTDNQALVGTQTGFVYEASPGVGSTSGFDNDNVVPMWKLGYDSEDFSSMPDTQVTSTALRHGNFDYVTRSVSWGPSTLPTTLPNSLYLAAKPAFFGSNPWPWVEPTATTAAERVKVLPAKQRFLALP